jgi:hypothetical protein
MGIWCPFDGTCRKSRSRGPPPEASVSKLASSEQRLAISTPKPAQSCSTVPLVFVGGGVLSRGFGGTDGSGGTGRVGGAATAMATASAVNSRRAAASSWLWSTSARGQLEAGATIAP